MSKPSGDLSFEKALAELEKIVARMESGELSLEDSLATHKRGPRANTRPSGMPPGVSSVLPPLPRGLTDRAIVACFTAL